MAKMITIIGPTACGKTAVATQLAVRVGGEVISADSRQVYRRMDIGTGKDLADYEVGGRHVPYHLIDIAEPGTKYNLFQYQHDFLKAYESIQARGAQPILCGGTGLYVEAVLRGYRLAAVPENKELRERLEGKSLAELTEMLAGLKRRNGSVMHNTTDVDTAKRAIRAIEIETFNGENPTAGAELPPIDSLIVGLDIGREERRRRITERLRQRLDSGMVDEVRSLLESGVAADDLIYYGLEYKYVTEYAIGRIGYDEMFAQLEIAIHQFAKRQMTWFRGMERRGLHIHWIDAMRPVAEKVDEIIRMM
jgi:tRNA dimethylallyltransferase